MEEERRRFRLLAHTWLERDLDRTEGRTGPWTADEEAQALREWWWELGLALVRVPLLDRLPAEERERWRALWTRVDDLRSRFLGRR